MPQRNRLSVAHSLMLRYFVWVETNYSRDTQFKICGAANLAAFVSQKFKQCIIMKLCWIFT